MIDIAASPTARPSAQPDHLDPMRTGILIGAGAFLWCLAVFLIRAIEPLGVLANAWTPLVYALVVLVTARIVLVAPRRLGLPQSQAMACSTIMAATASLLDGIALRWFPWIYGSDPQALSHIAASLLWAIGVAAGLCAAGSAGASHRSADPGGDR